MHIDHKAGDKWLLISQANTCTLGCKYEPNFNPESMDFARHYQTTILPARPKAPRDKALVEGAVKIVYAWIFARLRNRIFHDLKELNFAVHEELDIQFQTDANSKYQEWPYLMILKKTD